MIEKPSVLIKLSSLYEKMAILHDNDGEIWYFRDFFANGAYPRYTLTGKTVNSRFTWRAYLYAMFMCDKTVSVYIEDIITSKQGKHVGSWMMNRLIDFLRICNSVLEVSEIRGYYLPDRKETAERFFSKFGYQFRTAPDGKLIVRADLSDLKLAPLKDLKEIEIEDMVRGWVETL